MKFAKFLRTPFFTEHVRWLFLEISHELSFYCIREQRMVSFRGTYGPSSAYFILLRVFGFNCGVASRFLSGVSRGELPYLVIHLTGLVQFWKELIYILPPLAS